jgi:TetR/AcrR family transcriptional regulator, cholesterol catabolism regulator
MNERQNKSDRSSNLSKAEVTSDRLIEVAARLFKEKGYANTTVRDIANAAGMKAGSMYYHYASKDEVLHAVMERANHLATTGFDKALTKAGSDADFETKLVSCIEAHLRNIMDFGNFSIMQDELQHQLPNDLRKQQLAIREEYDLRWRNLFDEGRSQGVLHASQNLTLLRLIILGSMNWSEHWLNKKRTSLNSFAKIIAAIMIRGASRQMI